MLSNPIPIDLELLLYIAQALDAVPECLYEFQKLKTLSVGNRPVFHKLIDSTHDPIPKQLQIVQGDFSVIGEMTRLKKLSIYGRQIKVFPDLSKCTVLENLSLEHLFGRFDCATLAQLVWLKRLKLHCCGTLVNFSKLGCLIELQQLTLDCDEIEDLHFLEQLQSLQSLKITGHFQLDCAILTHLPNLTEAEFAGHIRLKHLEAVNQEQIKLTIPPVQEKKDATEKKPRSWKTPIPFQYPAEVENHTADYVIATLSSPQWNTYTGAYGSVHDRIEKLLLRDEEFEYYLDCLCSDLCHQMSFYSGTYLAIPYLAMLLREAWTEKNTLRQYQIIIGAGMILTTDTSSHKISAEVDANLKSAMEDIALHTSAFLATNLAAISSLDAEKKVEFATAVLAILGDRLLANILVLLSWSDCDVLCSQCGHFNGNMQPNRKNKLVEPAPVPIGWDGKRTEDTYLWLHNLLQLLGTYEAAKRISYYFGTYHCPVCGAKLPLLDGVKFCLES